MQSRRTRGVWLPRAWADWSYPANCRDTAALPGDSPSPRRAGVDGGGGDQDLLDENASIQAGIFGVLYTLAKEKYDSSKKFAVAKLVLDFVQVFLLLVGKDFGWYIDEDLW